MSRSYLSYASKFMSSLNHQFSKPDYFSSGIAAGLVLCLIASMLYLSTPPIAHAEDPVNVSCNVADLRDKIHQANQSEDPQTLHLFSGCVYMLFGPYANGMEADSSGTGSDGLPIISSEITIQGDGATISRSSQSGVPEFRILELTSSANLSLYDLTISGGMMIDTHTGIKGGGIYNNGGRLTLTNVTLSNNRAFDSGGSILAESGSITYIIDSVISGNSSSSLHSIGGGIKNNGELHILDTLFAANSSNTGGGIYNAANTILTIQNSTFTGNSSIDGAGIYNDGGSVNISNSTLYANSSTGKGGGIFNSSANSDALTVVYSTLYKNSATLGGGIFTQGAVDAALVQNSIIANSSSGANCSGSLDNNKSLSNLGWPGTDTSCFGQSGQFGDPKLNPLGKYGGHTPTLSLQVGSKAIDASNDVGCPSTDQRGADFPRPYGPHCDIGAFEGTINLIFVYLPSVQK